MNHCCVVLEDNCNSYKVEFYNNNAYFSRTTLLLFTVLFLFT